MSTHIKTIIIGQCAQYTFERKQFIKYIRVTQSYGPLYETLRASIFMNYSSCVFSVYEIFEKIKKKIASVGIFFDMKHSRHA